MSATVLRPGFPDSEVCEACELRFPIHEMAQPDEEQPYWMCAACIGEAIEGQRLTLVRPTPAPGEPT